MGEPTERVDGDPDPDVVGDDADVVGDDADGAAGDMAWRAGGEHVVAEDRATDLPGHDVYGPEATRMTPVADDPTVRGHRPSADGQGMYLAEGEDPDDEASVDDGPADLAGEGAEHADPDEDRRGASTGWD